MRLHAIIGSCAAQVHEKSILIPLLPVTLLAPELRLARWLPAVAVLSMAPLLLRDGLGLASAALLLVWVAVVGPGDGWGGLAAGPAGDGTGQQVLQRRESGRATARRPSGIAATAKERIAGCAVYLHERTSGIAAAAAASVCALAGSTTPPARYPFLHDAAFTCVSFLFFVAALCELMVHTYCL